MTAAVFDLRGRRVATLLDGVALAAGEHALAWNGRDAHGRRAAGGAYALRVVADGRTAVLRMMLSR